MIKVLLYGRTRCTISGTLGAKRGSEIRVFKVFAVWVKTGAQQPSGLLRHCVLGLLPTVLSKAACSRTRQCASSAAYARCCGTSGLRAQLESCMRLSSGAPSICSHNVDSPKLCPFLAGLVGPPPAAGAVLVRIRV